MEEAVAIITINSTAGMEALEKLKPCFVFGDAIYKEESVVLPVTSETFTQSLNKWHKNHGRHLGKTLIKLNVVF